MFRTRPHLAFIGLRYLVVGVGSVAVYLGVAALLHRGISVDPVVANAMSYGLATLANYVANFYWTFETSRSHRQATWRFAIVVAAGLILNSLYVSIILRATNLPLEVIGFSFAALWPLCSFIALKMWALR